MMLCWCFVFGHRPFCHVFLHMGIAAAGRMQQLDWLVHKDQKNPCARREQPLLLSEASKMAMTGKKKKGNRLNFFLKGSREAGSTFSY